MAEMVFDTPEEQHAAATRGMWTFLATEVLFFGVLFAAYTVYRIRYPGAFRAGSAKEELTLGTINTGVLLTSSWFVAIAGLFHAKEQLKKARWALLGAAALGTVFLVIKGIEYAAKADLGLIPGRHFSAIPPQMNIFFALYFTMTGLHALHLLIGVVALTILALRIRTISPAALENVGLYWHFIDAIWVVLFPLFYLVR